MKISQNQSSAVVFGSACKQSNTTVPGGQLRSLYSGCGTHYVTAVMFANTGLRSNPRSNFEPSTVDADIKAYLLIIFPSSPRLVTSKNNNHATSHQIGYSSLQRSCSACSGHLSFGPWVDSHTSDGRCHTACFLGQANGTTSSE
jgi:hypothetical protein